MGHLFFLKNVMIRTIIPSSHRSFNKIDNHSYNTRSRANLNLCTLNNEII